MTRARARICRGTLPGVTRNNPSRLSFEPVLGHQARVVLECLPLAAMALDARGRIMAANKAAAALFGPALAIGNSLELVTQTVHFERPGGIPISMQDLPPARTLRHGGEWRDDQIVVRRPNGETSLTRWTCRPWPGAGTSKSRMACLCCIEDTSSGGTSSDLPACEVFSLIVHELRTPLTAIKGHSQLLLRRPERMNTHPEAAVESLQAIVDQSDTLANMVSRLLDVARAQMGGIELSLDRVDLVALAANVVRDMQRLTDHHHIYCSAEESALVGQWDASHLRQVFVNLIENAIKYSPYGGDVEVTVRQQGSEAVVAVRDQGIGMSQEAMGHLFHSFYRSKEARDTGARGLGVGLFITNQIIVAHGGRLWATSTLGGGSVFYFALPLNA